MVMISAPRNSRCIDIDLTNAMRSVVLSQFVLKWVLFERTSGGALDPR